MIALHIFSIIVIATCFILFLISLGFSFLRKMKLFRLSQKFKVAKKAEGKIASMLKSHGYDLLHLQKSIDMTIYINQTAHRYQIKPDGMAKKDDKYFFVEMKTGKVATSALYKETRRQLLEYYICAPDISGILLLDGEKSTLKLVQFELKNTLSKSIQISYSKWIILFLILTILSLIIYIATK